MRRGHDDSRTDAMVGMGFCHFWKDEVYLRVGLKL